MSELNVNDGKGLFDGFGLIDTLIEDCNEIPKDLISGQNIRFCTRLVGIVQKLVNLKDGFRKDLESKDQQIRDLQRFIKDLNGEEDNQNG